MSVTKRKRQKRSFVWEYFEMIINERSDAPKKPNAKFCEIIQYNGPTNWALLRFISLHFN
jgi:hypothetical protein